MLREALEYILTPCPRLYRRMGHLKEAVATAARARRTARHWAAHLEASRRIVRAAVAATGRRERCIIFGAGIANDLPLGELAAGSAEVWLVDVVHLPAVRLAAVRYPALRLVGHDVTESLAAIDAGRLGAARPSRFLDDGADLVISANIVSQLPVMPSTRLDRRGVGEAEVERLAHDLVAAHLDYLGRFSGKVALIADVERIVEDRSGARLATIDAVHGVRLPWDGERWRWDIAPLGDEHPDHRVYNIVTGIPDLAAAAPAA